MLVNLVIGTIASYGQINLNEEQFKFYGDAVIDNGILKKDTALLHYKIIINKIKTDSIDLIRVGQIGDLRNAIAKDTTIRNNYKKSYSDCTESKVKLKKWNKFFKNTTVTLVVVAIIETGLIYFTFKK